MSLVSLDVARSHCRSDGDDDGILQVYLDAAEQSAIDYLNRKVYATQQSLDDAVLAGTAGEHPMVVNGVVVAAILLTCGHLYANREDVVVGAAAAVQIPFGATALLRPHRIMPGL